MSSTTSFEQCLAYNTALALHEKLRQAREALNFEEANSVYQQLFSLSLQGLPTETQKSLCEQAPASVKEKFIFSDALELTPLETQSGSMNERLITLSQTLSEEDLKHFDSLLDQGIAIEHQARLHTQIQTFFKHLADPEPFTLKKQAEKDQTPMLALMANKEESSLAFVQALAKVLAAHQFSENEIKVILLKLRTDKVINFKAEVSMILKGLSKAPSELEKGLSGKIVLPQTIPQFLKHAETLPQLPTPARQEALLFGVYRVSTPFFHAIACGRGPDRYQRQITLMGIITQALRGIFGPKVPEKLDRDITTQNKLKGWRSPEYAFPPPITPEDKQHAIELLKDRISQLNLKVDKTQDYYPIAEKAMGLFFGGDIILNYDYVEQLSLGITSLRLKFENLRNYPDTSFSSEEIRRLAKYLNMTEDGTRELIKDRAHDSKILDQLTLLEHAKTCLFESYNNRHFRTASPAIQRALAEVAAANGLAEDLLKTPSRHNIDYGITTATNPVAPDETLTA